MKNYKITLMLLLGTLMIGCATNPFTGKKTMALVGNNELFTSSFQQYGEFIKENKVVTGTADAQLVNKVGEKIKKAAETYLKANGYSNYLKDYKWEYKLVQDKAANAWCMPGGKIVVYTGILPITKTESGLATVMGHEVAHALANHGQQRMSANVVQQLGAAGLSAATANSSAQTQELAMAAYGGGSNLIGVLPFSRKHETEADDIGLLLMAIAGYNPSDAVSFWERMAKQGGSSQPEFLSTHPSNTTRINNLKEQIPIVKRDAAKYKMK
ncbi:M48 family metallopeptidase [Flavobacterium sp. I3-2]|uniref:M48 family metallopeptidase n=1 Tax=Flavobacterium sp. I3-2 TaxID=2748319 RepID=UPI0015A7ABA7|nr:M48 family metallopeptidase [Flavobacterium sp. I3-2]